jgi:hypothetical protein
MVVRRLRQHQADGPAQEVVRKYRGTVFSSRGRGTGLAGPQAQRPPRGWSLRLQSCLSSFGQATEAKRLASRGLQGLAQYTQ